VNSGNCHLQCVNKEKSHLQLKVLEKLERAVAVIEHKDPHFRLSRVFTIDGHDDSMTLELMTDGKERSSEEGDQTHYSRLYWDGNSLVFVTRIVAPQGEALNTVRYQLVENGQLLKAEEKFRGPRLKYDNLWVFEKKPSEEPPVAFECRLAEVRPVGDQDLFVGEVLAVHHDDQAFNSEGVLNPMKVHPLLYLGSDFYLTIDPDTLKHIVPD
jgi:hypothetical protein